MLTLIESIDLSWRIRAILATGPRTLPELRFLTGGGVVDILRELARMGDGGLWSGVCPACRRGQWAQKGYTPPPDGALCNSCKLRRGMT